MERLGSSRDRLTPSCVNGALESGDGGASR